MEADSSQKQPRTLSHKRKWLFRGLAVLGSVVVIEFLSWLGVVLIDSDNVRMQFLHERQHELAMGRGLSDGSTEVIHPYLGWVHNPQTAPAETILGKTVSVNALGFQDNANPLPRKSDDTFVVGIFGGSVAWQMGIAGSPVMQNVLEADPLLEGKTVEVVVLAMSSYKQPQQLLAYNYLTALGAEFDAVINIDGFNEVALAVIENFDNHTSMAYPQGWHARAIQLADPKTSEDALTLLKLRAHRQAMARHMDASFLKWSPTANLVWHFRDARAASQLHEFGLKVVKQHSGNFMYHGPEDSFADEAEMHQGVVDLWFRSSLQLHASCLATKTIYVHVLQPNQYHEGSKPMGPDERQIAISPISLHGKPIREIYPLVIASGRELAAKGVRFSDQSMLFADVEEPIYIDPCCHYNKQGNEMLAQKVAEELRAALRQRKRRAE